MNRVARAKLEKRTKAAAIIFWRDAVLDVKREVTLGGLVWRAAIRSNRALVIYNDAPTDDTALLGLCNMLEARAKNEGK